MVTIPASFTVATSGVSDLHVPPVTAVVPPSGLLKVAVKVSVSPMKYAAFELVTAMAWTVPAGLTGLAGVVGPLLSQVERQNRRHPAAAHIDIFFIDILLKGIKGSVTPDLPMKKISDGRGLRHIRDVIFILLNSCRQAGPWSGGRRPGQVAREHDEGPVFHRAERLRLYQASSASP
jgi:hypothetical protein